MKVETVKGTMFSRQDLMALMIPLVIEQFLARLVGMADTMMVSYAGEAAVSGVSLVDMINQLVITLLAALATGGAVVTSQYLGARLEDQAHKSVNQLVLLAGVFGIGLMAICLLLAKPMLRLFFGSIEEDVMAAALLYFRILACSYPFMALYNAGAAIFRSVGNSKISMQVSAVMNIINIGGNAFCIFVLGMGIEGVAIPSLISYAIAAVVMLWLAAEREGTVRVELAQIFRFDKGMSRSILNIGIPSAAENSIFQLGRVLVVSIISVFGTVQISANAIANNLDGMGCIIGQAFGLGIITVIGQCIGAGEYGQAKYYTNKLIGLDVLLQGTSIVLILIFLNPLIGLYSVSQKTADLAFILVWIHEAFSILMWPPAFVLPNALRAANDVKFTMWVSIGSMFIWRLGFSYVLGIGFQMGAIGVWIAMVVDWACRLGFFGWRYLSGRWLDYAKVPEKTAK